MTHLLLPRTWQPKLLIPVPQPVTSQMVKARLETLIHLKRLNLILLNLLPCPCGSIPGQEISALAAEAFFTFPPGHVGIAGFEPARASCLKKDTTAKAL